MSERERRTTMTPEQAEAEATKTLWAWLSTREATVATVGRVIDQYAWSAALKADDTDLYPGFRAALWETFHIFMQARTA